MKTVVAGVVILWVVLSLFIQIAMVGKEREPLESGEANWFALQAVLVILAVVYLARA